MFEDLLRNQHIYITNLTQRYYARFYRIYTLVTPVAMLLM